MGFSVLASSSRSPASQAGRGPPLPCEESPMCFAAPAVHRSTPRAAMGSRIFQAAASSPSSRNVRHFALPPALTNSSSGVFQRRISPRSKLAMQPGAIGVGDYRAAQDDGVTGELRGLRFTHGNQIVDQLGNRLAAISVERLGIIDRRAWEQRTEARVEVIKPRLNQLQGNNAAFQQVADLGVTADFAPRSITGKQRIAAEQGVAGAFEIRAAMQRVDMIPMLREPLLTVRLFALPLGMAKMSGHGLIAVDQGGIGGKHQIRQPQDRTQARDPSRRRLPPTGEVPAIALSPTHDWRRAGDPSKD